MSDLIRREDVIKLVNQFVFGLCKEQNDEVRRTFNKYIEKMPTAYDIDKIVEELEKREEHYVEMLDWQGQSAICDAIEIVKQGGVSDKVCELIKQYKNYDWQPSCETNSVYNVAGVGWFKFCPYCGKKIMVVE